MQSVHSGYGACAIRASSSGSLPCGESGGLAAKNNIRGFLHILLSRRLIEDSIRYCQQANPGGYSFCRFESLPGGLPLDLRKNIVLTTNPEFHPKGVTVVHSLKELFEELGEEKDEAFVMGGQSIYEQLLPYCDVVHVTRIDQAYEADTYFPDLDQKPEWKITAESDEQTYFDLEYTFVRYERKKS